MVKKSILNDKPKILIKQYRLLLQKKGIPVERIILFGSYAKGKVKYWSDLDICVVSKIFGKNSYQEMVRLKQLASEIEPMIEPHPYHPADLENPFDSLAHEIKKSGKVLFKLKTNYKS